MKQSHIFTKSKQNDPRANLATVIFQISRYLWIFVLFHTFIFGKIKEFVSYSKTILLIITFSRLPEAEAVKKGPAVGRTVILGFHVS